MDPRTSLRLITIGCAEAAESRPLRQHRSEEQRRQDTLRTTGDCAVVPECHVADALDRLPAARIAEIRLRLEKGMYASPLIAGELANRLLESGDI